MTLCIILILLGLLVPTILRARALSDGVTCMSNLRQIGFGFSLYAMDNGNRLPNPGDTMIPWEFSLHRYVPNPHVYECPADHEIGPVIGSSYDWRDTGVDATTLAGKPLLGPHRQRLVLAFEELPGWHVRRFIYAAWIDGSVHSMEEDDFFTNLDQRTDGQ